MAARLTREERLARLIEKCRADVNLTLDVRSLSQAPDRLLGSLARAAGYERVSLRFCEELDSRLRAARITPWPDLTDPTNTRKTRIYLLDSDHQIPGIQHSRVLFDEERSLSEFLQKNFKALPWFKKAGLRYLGAEVALTPGNVIDLLAEDKKTHELVGIELKAGAPDKGLVYQAGRYMDALQRKAMKDGRPGARLLIVAGQPDEEFRSQVEVLAEKRNVPTEWLIYTVSLSLKESP